MISLVNWNRDDRDENGPNRMCSFSGWLWKMKKAKKVIVPQWNKRWFSIEGRYFRWYELINSTQMSGSVDLTAVEGIKALDSTQGAFQFVVIYPDRKLVLRAADHHDRSKWIRALQSQADLARGGLGTGIIGDVKVDENSPDLLKLKKRSLKSRSLESDLDRTLKELESLERQLKLEADMLTLKESAQREIARSAPKEKNESSSRSSSQSSKTRGDETSENESHTSENVKGDKKNSKRISEGSRAEERRYQDDSKEPSSRRSSHSSLSVSRINITDKDDRNGEIGLLEEISSEPRKLNRRNGSKNDVYESGLSPRPGSGPKEHRDDDRNKPSAPPSFEIFDNAKQTIKPAVADIDEFDIPEVDLTVRKAKRGTGKAAERQRLSRDNSPEPRFSAAAAPSVPSYPSQRISRDAGPGPVGRTTAVSRARHDDDIDDDGGGRSSGRKSSSRGSEDRGLGFDGASRNHNDGVDPDFDYGDLKDKSRRSRREWADEGRRTSAAADATGPDGGSRPGSGRGGSKAW